MINAPVEVVKNQKIVVDQIQNIINQFKNQKKIMENLIIYLALFSILALIIALFGAYSRKNIIKKAFDQKVKELDAKDSTINSQKDELKYRKEEIESQRSKLVKAKEDLELVKAGLDSCRDDLEKAKADNKKLTENFKLELSGFYNEKEALQSKITTLEEENQELLTKLNSKPNGKRNPKN